MPELNIVINQNPVLDVVISKSDSNNSASTHNIVNDIMEINAWRYTELATIKKLANQFKSEVDLKEQDKFILRSFVPMIYAHWEGFCVSAFKEVQKYLKNLKLKPLEANINLVVRCFDQKFNFLKSKQSFEQRKEFTTSFHELYFSEFLTFDTKVDTRSNLRYEVLKDLCIQFDFEIDNFSAIEGELEKLVNIRNSIAHGENGYILGRKMVFSFVQTVEDAFDILLLEINNYLLNEKFKNMNIP